MTKIYPISCIECRRRKIKCNKINPCNQCVKKGIQCEYPAKFRSIEITELIEEDASKVPANLIKKLSNKLNYNNNNTTAQIKIEDNQELKLNKSNSNSNSPGSINDNIKIPIPISSSITRQEESNESTEIPFTKSNSKNSRIEDEIPNQQDENPSKKRDITKLESTDDILLALKKENETLKLKLKDMKLRTRQARIENKLNSSSYIRKFISNENNEIIGGSNNHDPDNNTERYYGPNSTQFMISNTGSDKIHLNDFDNFMKVKRQIRQKRNLPLLLVEKNTPVSTPDSNSPASLSSSSSNSANNNHNNNNITNPITTTERDNSSPPVSTNISNNNNNNMNKKQMNRSLANSKENIDLIIKVVKRFSHLRNYYSTFIDTNTVIEFLNNYNNIKEWNNDDDLLLIITIIITTLRSLPENDKLITDNKLNFLTLREPLYKQYRNLKNGIRTDTLTCLQSYILECEDLFYCDFIEKSWSLLFRIVCSSYSLGLHVYDKSIIEVLKNVDTSSSNNKDNNSNNKNGSNSNGNANNTPMMGSTNNINPIILVNKHPRAAVWFVINFLSATLCSILGRPNPVTFSFSPLLKNYQIRLNYKIAISELIKRSTNLLIESYKIDIDYKLVCNIDEEFVNEAIVYEKILSDTRALRVSRSRDKTKPCQITLPVMEPSYRSNKKLDNNNGTHSNDDNNNNYSAPMRSLSHIRLSELLNDCPLDIRFPILIPCKICKENEENCLMTSDGDTLADLILIYGNRAKFHQHFMNENDQSKFACIDSVMKVLEHCITIVELLKEKLGSSDYHSFYPFFYTFAYQTLVVIYTFMKLGYSKIKQFYDEISKMRYLLINLFNKVDIKKWRPAAIMIIKYIDEMCDVFFKEHSESMIIGVNNGINNVIHTRNSLSNNNINHRVSHMNGPENIQIAPPPPPPSATIVPNMDSGFPPHALGHHHQPPQPPQIMVDPHQNQQQILPQPQPLQPQGLQPIINSNLQHHHQLNTPPLVSSTETPTTIPDPPMTNHDSHPQQELAEKRHHSLNLINNNKNSYSLENDPRETQITGITGNFTIHTVPENIQNSPVINKVNDVNSNNRWNGINKNINSDSNGNNNNSNLNYHSLSQLLLSNFNFDTFIASSNGTTGTSTNNINTTGNNNNNNNNYNNNNNNLMSPNDDNDDNFVIDPLLGFDLNDPFFVQNPSNFNVARPDPPMHENSEDSLSLTFSDKDDTGYLSISAMHNIN